MGMPHHDDVPAAAAPDVDARDIDSQDIDRQDINARVIAASGTNTQDADVGLDVELRTACVEQAMRCCADESIVQRVAAATSRRELLAIVGCAIADLGSSLRAGSPLLVAAGHGSIDPHWRTNCPPAPGSLLEELLFLRPLVPPSLPSTDLLSELVAARNWVEG